MQVLERQIITIEAEKIRPLRHTELRQGQPFSTTSYLRDDDPNTFHMACLVDNKVVTCATFYPQETEKILSKNSYRLRGMATDSNYRRKGYGRDVMEASFQKLKVFGADILWCNARLAAISFYEFLGFKIIGEKFNIEGIGGHYYMYKEI
tara:strand:+ start:17 stop:466 length:450 start_codon:yes stop_codon:yes gene_type:complete